LGVSLAARKGRLKRRREGAEYRRCSGSCLPIVIVLRKMHPSFETRRLCRRDVALRPYQVDWISNVHPCRRL
jgi:hypothetical protein